MKLDIIIKKSLIFLAVMLFVLSPLSAADLDLHPSVVLTASPESTDTISTLVITAFDFGENAGLSYIELYENGVLLDTKSCYGDTNCILTKVVTETMPTTNEYYAVVQDDGGNVVQSSETTVTFTGFDIQPSIMFSASPETTDTTTTLIATGIDVLGNAGLSYIEIYEDGQLLGTKSCLGETTCVFTKVVTNTMPETHTYYAVSQDDGGNVVQSQDVTVTFLGLDAQPSLTLTATPETTDTTSTLVATAIDTMGNSGLSYIELYEDGDLIETKSCFGATSCVLTKVITEATPDAHNYYAVTQDDGGNVVQSQDVTVTFLGMDAQPTISISASPETTDTTSTVMVTATDSMFNAGLSYIELYENGNLIETKSCFGGTTCTLTNVVSKNIVGTYTYYAITQDDGGNVVQSDNAQVTFLGLNTPPLLTGLPDLETVANVAPPPLDLWPYANDAESEDWELEFDVIGHTNPSLVTCYVSNNRYVMCNTPGFAQTGTAQITVEVSDGYYTSVDSFIIEVSEENAPLFLEADAGGPYSAEVGTVITLNGDASNGEPAYTYEWDLNNDGVFETPGQNVPFTQANVGGYVVVLRVTDSVGNQAIDIATVSFTQATVAPPAPAALTAVTNGPYVCTTGVGNVANLNGGATGGVPGYAYAWDLDNNLVYETATQNPAFSCNVPVGVYTVNLQVTDSAATVAVGTTTVTVNAPGANNAPVLNPIPDQTIYNNELYNYDVDAVDADGDTLTYSLDAASLARGMTINAGTGVIAWTPDSLGDYIVTVTVDDGNGGTDSATFTLTVSTRPADMEIDHRLLVRAHIVGDDHVNPGDMIRLHTNVENIDNDDFRGLTITAVVQELAMRDRAGPMLLEEDEEVTKNLYLEVPENAGRGLYAIRITIEDTSTGELRRVFYREFRINE